MTQRLVPQVLTAEDFSAFGDVIECPVESASEASQQMNDARFERHHALSSIDHDPGVNGIISIAQCRVASQLPYRIDLIERHPHGSQAFIPLSPFVFVVVVAPPGENPGAEELRAFVTNGQQGIAYRRGTWHMPLIGLSEGQQFLVVDADDTRPNCDELYLDSPVWLEHL